MGPPRDPKVGADAASSAPRRGELGASHHARMAALRTMPMHIADNAGYDSADLIAKLRAKHHEGGHTWGLEMNTGTIADMTEVGICESYKVKSQVVLSASEAAEMILRVDDLVQCAPRQRDGQ